MQSSLREVTAIAATALNAAGIQAVLTGGACASLYSRGLYQSADIDFVLSGRVSRAGLERALLAVGFQRDGDRFVHHRTRYYIEFPRGPLAIGSDVHVRPVEARVGSRVFLALSPTDSCRDRLAAFYFWTDRQSLRAAVWIARRNRIDVAAIWRWSRTEGYEEAFEEFLALVRLPGSNRRRRR